MATSWNTADLWERHEQAIKVLYEGCQPDLRATRQGRERLLRRHEIALEFELAAADESRKSIEVDLSSLKASPAWERRLARVAATGIPFLSVLRDSRTPPRFTDGGRKRLMQLLDVLGLSRQALGLVSESIETYLERWPEHSNQQGYLIARIVMLMAERRALTIPVDIVPVSASEQIEIATYARREDWLSATGALPKGDSPLSINLTLPVATYSRWTALPKQGAQSSQTSFQWVMTPNATWSSSLLRYLQEVLSLGYRVTCSLRRSTSEANTPAEELNCDAITLPVHRAVPRFQGRRHGLYFEPNFPLDLGGLRGRAPFGKHITNAELFLNPTVTHIVTPVHADAIRRLAFSVPGQSVESMVRDIAQGGPSGRVPLIEAKTPVFRYYVDIDLYWDLYKTFDAYTELKELQLQFFDTNAKEAFANLGDLLGWMYPLRDGGRPRAMASRRSQSSGSKDGYHVVFPDVLLPNDGRTGGLVTGQLEMAAARAFSRASLSEPLRFLVHMLLNDWQHLGERMSPITCRVRGSAIASVGATTREDLRAAITENLIVSLRDRDVQLSDQLSAKLIGFALESMGQRSLDRHIDRILGAPTLGARGTAMVRLTRRCVWEIRRRARLFDRSVYAPTMGLRMMGTRKPGDERSAYVPMNGNLTVESIAAHSIRAPKAVPSVPGFGLSRLLHASGLGPNGRNGFSPQLLDGLLMKAREEERATLSGLVAEFQIHPRLPAPKANETVVLRLMDDRHKDDKKPPKLLKVSSTLASNAKLNGALNFAPFLAKYQELDVPERGRINVHPPRRRPFRVLEHAQALNKRAHAEIKVRVFIPSPTVSSTGHAYGGDDRGQQYTGGTSRLDITATINLTTGAVSYQAAWGEMTEYDWDDTARVPDKPSWWLGKTPSAQPVDSERLQVTSENVRVSASSRDGKTTVSISYSGANPLSPVAHAIDGQFTVIFNADGSLTIRAMHDGFPAHTMYVNSALVYNYDPVARGSGPGALAGGMNEGSTVTYPHVPSGRQPDGGLGGGGDGRVDRAGETEDGDAAANEGDAWAGNPEYAGPDDDNETEGEAPGDAVAADAPESTEYPIDVDQNADGSVTITVREGSGEFSETLTYDEGSQWTGSAGSAVSGGPDLFDDTGGWSLIENGYGCVTLIKRRKGLTRR